MDTKKAIQILDTIAADMEQDAKDFDGKPFTGKTVATYFGYQGAAIAGLAKIVKVMITANDMILPNGKKYVDI